MLSIPPNNARSDEQQERLISDDEIEEALQEWLRMFFDVAGITLKPKVYVVLSNQVNAGATFGGEIIVYTGLILKCREASQLLGVLAHETGHIAASHLVKAYAIQAESAVPALAAAAIGGAAALLSGNGAPLGAGLAAGMQIFERSILRHSREQEESADASALTYMTAKKLPVAGLGDFLDSLGSHYLTGHEDPYVQTHPLSSDRKQKVRLYQKEQTHNFTTPANIENTFKRIKAKLYGFSKTSAEVYREYPLSDKSFEATYARAIVDYRSGKSRDAAEKTRQSLDVLLKQSPDDSYIIELKGQICFEMGELSDAIKYLRQAVQKRKGSIGVRLMLGHALSEFAKEGQTDILREALEILTPIAEKKGISDPLVWRLLASVYGKLKKEANASACLAEESWITGQKDAAKVQAKKGMSATNPVLAKRSADIVQQIDPTKQQIEPIKASRPFTTQPLCTHSVCTH
jgi:predicted Zn-dependent protease